MFELSKCPSTVSRGLLSVSRGDAAPQSRTAINNSVNFVVKVLCFILNFGRTPNKSKHVKMAGAKFFQHNNQQEVRTESLKLFYLAAIVFKTSNRHS